MAVGILTRAPGGSGEYLRFDGFSLLELVVVICLIATLLVVALNRLVPYVLEAERVAVLTLEAQLRSSLVTAAARRIARGEAGTISQLNGTNPMDLMLDPPANYLGALRAADPAQIPGGHWYYETASHRLVYRPGNMFGLTYDDAATDRLEFEVRVSFDDRNGNGQFEPAIDELHGVRLRRVVGAHWLNKGKTDPTTRDGTSA